MATKMHIVQKYDCSARSLYELLTDEEFDKKLLAAANVERELLKREERDEGPYLELRLTPDTNMPGFMEKLVGGASTYVEKRTWNDEKMMSNWVIEPGKSPDKVDIHGTVKVKDAGDGTCERVIDGSFSVGIRFIGGKVEKFIVKQTKESFAEAEKFISKYIEENDVE